MGAEQPRRTRRPATRRATPTRARPSGPGSTSWGRSFLVAAIVIPLYRLLARQEAKDQPRRATVIETAPSPAAFPRLVTNEPQALAEFRAKEDAILDGYGWVEKDHGIARMPIAEALRIVGERGALPGSLPRRRRGRPVARGAAGWRPARVRRHAMRRAHPRCARARAACARHGADGTRASPADAGDARHPAADRLRPEARREDPARPAVQGRDRQGREARRLLRKEAGRAEPRLLQVPDAVHAQPERPRGRARGALLRARTGLRGDHGQLRSARRARARLGEEAGLHESLQALRGRAGLALPDRTAGLDRSPHARGGLPLRLGRGDEAVGPSRGCRWC